MAINRQSRLVECTGGSFGENGAGEAAPTTSQSRCLNVLLFQEQIGPCIEQ